jgi:structural maintenance of chromosome 4
MDEEPNSESPPMSPMKDVTMEKESIEEETTPARLMITQMVLENFKSYAGIKTIGPFHKCFSSVVGPNGSGKSNVIDAMLFVFGKRAKKLRLNKVSELIHSSAAYKDEPLEFARVSVYFQEIRDTGDGDEDYEVIPNSEIVVTRYAKRDNTSQYKLDGKNVSFKQVASYLQSKGIDLDNNRFLILQGEVEMISMMPPKGKTENDEGLLEYLEDIIGSNQYVEETNEAAAAVEELTEQRQEKLNRVKAVEKEKEGLEGAKLEAEALLNKEREIRRKKNILYQLNRHAASIEVKEAQAKKEEYMNQLDKERSTILEASQKITDIENSLAEKNSDFDRVKEELVKTKEEFASYERRDIELREEIKHAKENKKKLSTKVLNETKKEADAEAKGKEAEASIPDLEAAIQKLTLRKEEEDVKLEAIFEETKGVTEKLRKELEQKSQELAPVTQDRVVFQSALDTALTEVKLLEDSTTRAKEQVNASEKELATLDSKQDEKRKKLSEYEDELSQSQQRIVDAQTEDENLAEAENVLTKRHAQLTVSNTPRFYCTVVSHDIERRENHICSHLY